MIPKIIHYCWLSNDPIPQNLQKCMNSWKKYLPDYEFKLWNFDCFDINSSKWVKDAFENKKYAFAADYIRLYALYNYGGIYLDMDVEVLKSFNPFLTQREILGVENSGYPEVAVFGCERKCKWLKLCLNYYNNRFFVKENGAFDMIPLPMIIKKVLEDNGIHFKVINHLIEYNSSKENELYVYASDFFSPKSYLTGKLKISNNTVSIHHFAGTWVPWYELFEKNIWGMFGKRNKYYLNKIVNLSKKMKEKIKSIL